MSRYDDSIEVNESYLRSNVVREHGSSAEDDIRGLIQGAGPYPNHLF